MNDIAVTATPYGQALLAFGTGQVNLTSDTLKVCLLTSSYSPNVDTDDYYNDVSSYEVTSSGYTAGGATLAGKSLTYDATNNWAVLAASAVTWSLVTLTARYAAVYKSTGTATTSPLLGYIDFGADKTYTSEDAQLTFSNGVLRLKLPS